MANASNRTLTRMVTERMFPHRRGYVIYNRETQVELTDWITSYAHEAETRVSEKNAEVNAAEVNAGEHADNETTVRYATPYAYRWSSIPNPDIDHVAVSDVCDAVFEWIAQAVRDHSAGCEDGKKTFLEELGFVFDHVERFHVDIRVSDDSLAEEDIMRVLSDGLQNHGSFVDVVRVDYYDKVNDYD